MTNIFASRCPDIHAMNAEVPPCLPPGTVSYTHLITKKRGKPSFKNVCFLVDHTESH